MGRMLLWPVLALLAVTPAAELERSCTPCHKLDVVRRQRLERWEWSRELDKMTAMGAKVRNRKALLDYLVKNYGNE
jgi:hypothetical protein